MHDIVNNSVLSANYYMKKLIIYLRMRKEIRVIMHSETFLVRVESKENN